MASALAICHFVDYKYVIFFFFIKTFQNSREFIWVQCEKGILCYKSSFSHLRVFLKNVAFQERCGPFLSPYHCIFNSKNPETFFLVPGFGMFSEGHLIHEKNKRSQPENRDRDTRPTNASLFLQLLSLVYLSPGRVLLQVMTYYQVICRPLPRCSISIAVLADDTQQPVPEPVPYSPPPIRHPSAICPMLDILDLPVVQGRDRHCPERA